MDIMNIVMNYIYAQIKNNDFMIFLFFYVGISFFLISIFLVLYKLIDFIISFNNKIRIILFNKKLNYLFNLLTALNYTYKKIIKSLMTFFLISGGSSGNEGTQLIANTYYRAGVTKFLKSIYFPLLLILLCIRLFDNLSIENFLETTSDIDILHRLAIVDNFQNNEVFIKYIIGGLSAFVIVVLLTRRFSDKIRIYKIKNDRKNKEIESIIVSYEKLFSASIKEFITLRDNLTYIQNFRSNIEHLFAWNDFWLDYENNDLVKIFPENMKYSLENDPVLNSLKSTKLNEIYFSLYKESHDFNYVNFFYLNKTMGKIVFDLYLAISVDMIYCLSKDKIVKK